MLELGRRLFEVLSKFVRSPFEVRLSLYRNKFGVFSIVVRRQLVVRSWCV